MFLEVDINPLFANSEDVEDRNDNGDDGKGWTFVLKLTQLRSYGLALNFICTF